MWPFEFWFDKGLLNKESAGENKDFWVLAYFYSDIQQNSLYE